MTVKLPKMKEDEIKKLIKEQMLCRIAFKGKNYPYMAPFQYVYMNDTLYFHFTDYGRKMKFLEKDKRVCVEIEKYQPDMSEYNFVVLRGSIEIVNDAQERSRVITKMAEEGKRKLSRNFVFRFIISCILGDRASPIIERLPNALGPNSIRP